MEGGVLQPRHLTQEACQYQLQQTVHCNDSHRVHIQPIPRSVIEYKRQLSETGLHTSQLSGTGQSSPLLTQPSPVPRSRPVANAPPFTLLEVHNNDNQETSTQVLVVRCLAVDTASERRTGAEASSSNDPAPGAESNS